jgi:hypothetical protein
LNNSRKRTQWQIVNEKKGERNNNKVWFVVIQKNWADAYMHMAVHDVWGNNG